jgi:hypothetical protein
MTDLGECMTTVDCDRGMIRHRALGLSLALLLAYPTAVAAQSPSDSTKHHEDGPIRAWLSLGLGSGNSYVGGFPAARGAVSVAVNRILVFTLEETSLGGLDRSVASTNLLAGVQTPDPHQFFFLSGGWATTKCGNGCAGQSGIRRWCAHWCQARGRGARRLCRSCARAQSVSVQLLERCHERERCRCVDGFRLVRTLTEPVTRFDSRHGRNAERAPIL